MGWRDTAYGWLSQSARFVADTAWKVWDGIKTLPEVGGYYLINPAARKIGQSILHVIGEDILPYLFLNQALSSFQQYIDDTHENNPEAWPTYSALQMVNVLLQTSFFLYYVRQQQRLIARTTVLTLENNNTWPDIRRTKPFTICAEEKCTEMRFIHGNIRDLGIFYLTEIGIFIVSYLPYIGPYASSSLSIYHKGRYALSSVTPEVCQRHRLDYLDDNRSLALSLGLLHKGSVFGTSQVISLISNIPANKAAKMLDFLFMLPTVATASRLYLPPMARHEDPVQWKDPLGYYQRLMGWCVDLVLYGIKKKGPELFKGPKAVIDWDILVQQANLLSQHPAIRFAGIVLIDDCFHSMERVKQDPVIKHFWSKLCFAVAEISETAVDWGRSWTVKALTFNDMMTEFSVQFAHWYKRYPESLVKLLVKAIINPDVQDWLLQFAITLKKSVGCGLHWMPKLPKDFTQYQNSYIFCHDQNPKALYYITPEGKKETVTINDFVQFEKKLTKKNKKNSDSLYLSSNEIETLITSNGGHSPKVPNALSNSFFIRQSQTLGHLLERCFHLNHKDAYKAALIMVDALLLGAEPIRDRIQAKPKSKPENPLTPSNLTERKLNTTTGKIKRPNSIKFGQSTRPRPSTLSTSIFSPEKPDPHPTLHLRSSHHGF